MKIDHTKLTKWQEVVEFASDPERLSMLELLVSNGAGVVAKGEDRPRTNAVGVKTVPLSKLQEGTQIRAIAEAALACEGPFSGYDLALKMQAAGYKFTSDQPGLRVTDTLRVPLKKRGFVRIYRKGKGSEPMLFQRVLPQ